MTYCSILSQWCVQTQQQSPFDILMLQNKYSTKCIHIKVEVSKFTNYWTTTKKTFPPVLPATDWINSDNFNPWVFRLFLQGLSILSLFSIHLSVSLFVISLSLSLSWPRGWLCPGYRGKSKQTPLTLWVLNQWKTCLSVGLCDLLHAINDCDHSCFSR